MFDGKYFLKQIKGCSFEKNLDVVANLFLVLNNARPAYLYVQYDGVEEEQETILSEIKCKFPNVTITKKDFMNFIHIAPLLEINKDESFNDHLGKTLGFFFPGDVDKKENVYSSIHYLANETHFYAEVCKTLINDINEIEIKKREKKWNSILNNINITVTCKIDRWLTYDYILTIVSEKNISSILNNSKEFIAYFENSDYQLPKFASFLQRNLEDIFLKYHDYILMIILCKENGLFELDLKISETFEKLLDDFIVKFILDNSTTLLSSNEKALKFVNELVNNYSEWFKIIEPDILTTLTFDDFLSQKKNESKEIIQKFKTMILNGNKNDDILN